MASLENSPFSASSSWNTLVPENSSFTKLNWPTSTGYNYSVAWDSYSPAVYVASASDPIVQVTHPAGWGYPAGTVSIHMPAAANGAAGTDGELIIIDGDVAYNFWQFKRTSGTTATASSFGAENVVTGDGWGSKSPFLSAGITAVGASQLGGLLVKAETDDGSIDHALQLVVDSKLVMSGFTGNAIAGDGSSASGIVKEGQLLAISPNTPMPAGLSKLGQEVFTAMQKYGAYVVDVAGGVTNIRAQANAFDDATITALWHDMGKITPLLQGVSTPTGGGSSSSGGTGAVTPPPVTTPPVTTPPVTTPPVTTTPPSRDTTAPTLQWISASGAGINSGRGTIGVGGTVRLSVNFSEAVNVTGTPTLMLNSNGSARYMSGSGTNTLQFDYKVGAGQNTADLAITGFNLAGVKDKAGNALNLAGAPRQPAGTLAIDTAAPTMQWVAANGPGVINGNGTVGAGGIVRLSVNFSEAVNVTGTPTLTLNSNGTARYVSGSGTNTLQFDYKVGVGQNAADLEISGFNLAGVKDKAGNAVNLAGAPHQPAGTLAIRTTAPRAATLAAADSSSVTDTAATIAPTPAAGPSWDGRPSTSGSRAEPSPSIWSDFGNRASGGALSFGNQTTLGYAATHRDAGSSSLSTDASLMSQLALWGQYAASSFATHAPASTATPLQGALSNLVQTLTKPQG